MHTTLLGKGKDLHQTEHCLFRFVNILFSDAFAELFSVMGDSNKRSAIDANKASNSKAFWIDMQAAFVASKQNEACNKPLFQGNECLVNMGFNPQNTEQHSWDKL